MKKFTPKTIEALNENEIFVFGSNFNGNHAGGAARLAVEKFGAIQGQARGLQGQSYAIPTLNESMQKVSLTSIKDELQALIDFAKTNESLTFFVTKIGCGIAGFNEKEIADIFKELSIPENVIIPMEFAIFWDRKVENAVIANYEIFEVDWYYASDGNCYRNAIPFESVEQYLEFIKS